VTDAPAVAFAGTPEFAMTSLAALHRGGYDISVVLTQPDRRAGRGRRVAESPVKQFALAHGLPTAQPVSLPRDGDVDPAWGDRPDLLVAAAYGLILPDWMLSWPRIAPVNLHASVLPRWRGAAPIQHAILAGDAESGVSIMRMEQGLDTGPVYATSSIPIDDADTAGSLHNKLAELGARLLIDTLPAIIEGRAEPAPQNAAAATYAPKISKQDARVDWRCEASALARSVRAYDPWPVAEGHLIDGRLLRIWSAVAVAAPRDAPPGTIVAAGPDGVDVATGAGCLRITALQLPGGKPMSVAAFLNAHSLDGARFAV
jgi:methionyl-tRNA formyltransferase